MIQFILVCHGESESGTLTERGALQVKATTDHINEEFDLWQICGCVTSPFAIDTAQKIYEYLIHGDPPIVPRTSDMLREYALSSKISTPMAWKSDDTWRDFSFRVRRCIDDFENQHRMLMTHGCTDDKYVLVYGHPIIFSTLVTHVATQREYFPESVGAIAIKLTNCSITTIKYEDRKWSVLGIGNVNHLRAGESGAYGLI